MSTARFAFTLVALSAVTAPLLSAQSRQRDRGIVEVETPAIRGGFYISGGLGAGRETYKFSDQPNFGTGLTKPTISIRLGGTPNSRTRVGGEIFAWSNDVDDGTESLALFLLNAHIYPAGDGGLFLKVGGGFARSGIDFTNGSSTFETGFGWSLGAGLDIPLSHAIAIGPMMDFYQGTFTRRGEATLTERVLNIGAQVTFQTGGRSR